VRFAPHAFAYLTATNLCPTRLLTPIQTPLYARASRCFALHGVHSDYKPTFMWWELLMMWRQLFLVGFAILIRPGTVEQAVISFLASIFFLLLHAVAAPFKANGDNYMGQVSAHIRPRSKYRSKSGAR
jgi:hypothetical protein